MMAANLGQAFLAGAGIVPTLAQELASGNFHESRESFHDYIYSKLILGEDKNGNSGVLSPNPPVFPNTDLASSYPNKLPAVNSLYSQGSNNSRQNISESVSDCSSGSGDSSRGNVSVLPKTPSLMKSGSLKKKFSQIQQSMAQPVGTGSSEDVTKLKKKSHHKNKEKSYMCDVCGRGFAEKYTLNRHKLTHTHVKPYSCSKCNISFSRSDGLAKHMAAGHRRIDAHHCDVCGGTFNSEVSFEQHRREYGNTLPFVCNLCMLAFSQCCHLNYHMKSHSLSKMNDSLVSNDQDDKNNATDVSELIPDDFSLPKRDTSTNSLNGLFFTGAKSGDVYTERSDTSLGLLDPNIVIKPEVDDYTNCQAANNQTARGNSVQGSNVANSFDTLNNFPSVTSSSTLSHDAATNQSGTNVSSSDVSSPSFLPDTTGVLPSSSSNEPGEISDSDLKKYLDIKVPNIRFMDSSFLQGANISEDGLFRCEICGKGFTRKYHMQRHVKLHIRGPIPKAHLLDWTRRPFACGVCKMGFTRQHHLTRHMLIHTGERPHPCQQCGKAFRRYTNLTLHVRTVHGAERPYRCPICGRGFPRLYSLQRHLKLHAKNAAGLISESAEQLHGGFKPFDSVNLNKPESGEFPFYSSENPDSIHQSPGHSRVSLSLDQSGSSEGYEEVEPNASRATVGYVDQRASNSPVFNQDRFDQKASNSPIIGKDRFDQRASNSPVINQDKFDRRASKSPIINQDRFDQRAGNSQDSYSAMDDENHETGFYSQSNHHGHNNDQSMRSLPGQFELRSTQPGLDHQQVLPTTLDAGSRLKNNILVSSSIDGLIRLNTIQARALREFSPSPRTSSAPVGVTTLIQTINSGDYNQLPAVQNSGAEKLITGNSINAHEMLAAIKKNVSKMDNRETSNYSLKQRSDNPERYVVQQRIQSPHLSMSSLDRPGSRSMMIQNIDSDSYHQQQHSFLQQQTSLPNLQQSASHITVSPESIQITEVYSHNQHIDRTAKQNSGDDQPAYSHNQSGNISFSSISHLYQQQLSENSHHLDRHPNPSPSPISANSQSNKLQY